MPTVLAFDIGIKNLAFCILRQDASGSIPAIIALENINLMASPADSDAVQVCSKCSHKALYESDQGITCKRHIPAGRPSIVGPGEPIPTLPALKEVARTAGLSTKGARAVVLATILTRFSVPIKPAAKRMAAKQSLTELHDALSKFVQTFWEQFRTVDAVLLENQPAFKNPHMKSVQVLLFATLRDKFLTSSPDRVPPFHLVHAKVKVQNTIKGDAGYKDRKDGSERRLREAFETKAVVTNTSESQSQSQSNPYSLLCESKKKSDMADAFCMCMDFFSLPA
jgi:hypothetical protein